MSVSLEQFITLQEQFRANFDTLAGNLTVADLAAPTKYRSPLPIEHFSLVPVQAIDTYAMMAGQAWKAPDDVVIPGSHHRRGGPAYLEAREGLGWAYTPRLTPFSKRTLVALAAGELTPDGIHIEQVQGAFRYAEHPELKDGLRGGVKWDETLVRAWGAIAVQLGLSEISMYSPSNSASPLYQRYKNLAGRLCFDWDEERKVWTVSATTLLANNVPKD
jgi:hypothetical protein